MTLHLGFPGSLASLRQQAGRAGRREQRSLAVFVAFDSPLDQHFMAHPEHLFGRPVESAQVKKGEGGGRGVDARGEREIKARETGVRSERGWAHGRPCRCR